MDDIKISSPKNKAIKSAMLKCAGKMFFFDINKASNEKKYLKITESRFVAEGEEKKRSSFVLFPEDLPNFQLRLTELAGNLRWVNKNTPVCLKYELDVHFI